MLGSVCWYCWYCWYSGATASCTSHPSLVYWLVCAGTLDMKELLKHKAAGQGVASFEGGVGCSGVASMVDFLASDRYDILVRCSRH